LAAFAVITEGIVFSGWLVLLVAQVSLVARRRTDLHRQLGVLGGVLAAAMLGLGLALAVEAGRNGFQTPGHDGEAPAFRQPALQDAVSPGCLLVVSPA
jgi:hypothetical protein